MKKKFRNAFDYDYKKVKHEVNNLPTKTVPDMTMSLKEILMRYTRGGEVATLQPVYQEHDEFEEGPDISKMDALEKLHYAKVIKDAIKAHQDRPKAEKKPEPEPEGDKKGEAKREPKKEPEEKGKASVQATQESKE